MAPNPVVSFTAGSQNGFIGSTQVVKLSFDNAATGSETGYAPYIDVILPTNGADGAGVGNNPVNDGLTLLTAKYLGRDLVQTTVVFDAGGHAQHPFAVDGAGNPIIVTGSPGDTLLVLTLPFGSFTTEQTPADVVLTLKVSNLADVGTPLPITATGGFAYGADPLNNPSGDAPIRGAAAATQIDPVVAQLSKIYLGPEQETATGPSYPREWLVQGEFAVGQPFTNVVLTDRIPDGVVVTGAHLEDGNGNALPGTAIISGPYGSQTVTGTFTGTIIGGAVKPTVVIDFYVTEFLANGTPVLDQSTGAFRPLENNAKLDADWKPIDTRDANTHITIDPVGPENTVTAKSVAVQKSVALVSPTNDAIVNPDADANGVPDWQPGGTLKYTLDGQVSNYFEMKALVFKDTLGDGQTFKMGYHPKVVISEHGTVIFTGDVLYTIQPKDAAGRTYIEFDVAGTLAAAKLAGLLPNDDTVLDGNGGGLTGNPHATDYYQATAVVTFETTIDHDYTGPIGAGFDRLVDQGDPVNNDVLFGGQVNGTGNYIQDDSHAGVVLPVSAVDKSIYAINGDTGQNSSDFGDALKIQAGDLITYRLTLDMPLTSAHSVKLSDFLPLPVLTALDLDADTLVDGAMLRDLVNAIPLVGTWAYGPTDTLHTTAGTVYTDPAITRSGPGNSLSFNFGDITNPNYPSTHIDLLFTVRVNDAAFGDGLLLTNQVTSYETNSFGTVSKDNEIIQFVLGEPRLKITKGVVSDDNTTGAYDVNATTGTADVGPAGVTWNAPGSGTAFTGTITSAGLATKPVDANLLQADANDTVTFAIVLENVGSGPRGAFDALIKDTLPTGFTLGATPLNLHVTDGTGATITYTGNAADLFTTGIQLNDPGLHQGAIGAYNATSGKNIVVITYDLKLDSNVQSFNQITNTATTAKYAAEEGGIDRTPTDKLPDSDQAYVTVTPGIIKTYVSSNNADTTSSEGNAGLPDLAIGETVTWHVAATIPEGTTRSLKLIDILPGGAGSYSGGPFELVSVTTATVGSHITGAGIAAGKTGVLSDSNGDGFLDTVTFDFGDVTNAPDNVNTADDLISFDITARVLDQPANFAGETETNRAIVQALAPDNTVKQVNASSQVEIVEPHLNIDKTVANTTNPGAGTTGDAGDTFTYTVVLTNNASNYGAPAYEVSIDDLLAQLPPNATFLAGTVLLAAGAPAGTAIVTGNGGSDSTIKVTSPRLLEGESITFTFQAKANDTAITGQTVPNTVAVNGTSMPGTPPSDRTYTDTDGAVITLNGSSAIKTIVTTSYTDTGVLNAAANPLDPGNQLTSREDVKVDEVVTYKIEILLSEGETVNLKVTDILEDIISSGNDNGQLVYVPGSATIQYGANLYTDPGFTTALNSATLTTGNGPASGDAATPDQLVWSFGNVYNKPDANNASGAQDKITITLQAKVSDIPANQRADQLTNSVNVHSDNGLDANSSVDVEVVEPRLTVDKTASFDSGRSSGDAGDLATFTIVIAHQGGNNDTKSSATAYDIDLTDALPAGVSYVAGSLVTPLGVTASVDGAGKLTLHADALALGQSITLTYKVALLDSVVNAQTITNIANLDYQTHAPTQTDAPGRSFTTSDPATLAVSIVDDLSKVINPVNGTDNPYTTGNNLGVGETVKYLLTATLGEGSQNLIIKDTLPTGLTYLSSKVVSIDSDITGSVLSVGAAGTVSGQTTTFNFGTVQNAGNNNAGPDTVVVEVIAQVAPGTAKGTILTNTGILAPLVGTNPYGIDPTTPMPVVTKTVDSPVVAAQVGNQIFEDRDANGVYNAAIDSPLAGVTVTLFDSNGATVATTTTTADGLYQFTNLVPGVYTETFGTPNTPSLPGTWYRSPTGSGLTDNDSDASPTGAGQTITLTDNASDQTHDAGYFRKVSLGDTAFIDVNGDGIQNDGPAAVLANVKVELLNGGGAVVATGMTDGAGLYHFTDLNPGSYAVRFTAPDGSTYVLTPNDLGGNDALDSDASNPGTQSGTTPTKTYFSGDIDNSIDAGFYIPAKLGNQAFIDANGNGTFDLGEAGLAGVTVKLFVAGNPVAIATATTDANGLYLFEGLRPGTYTETFTSPTGSTFVLTKQGVVAGTDNDSDPSGTGTPAGTGPAITLVSGSDDRTHDAGFYQPVTLGDRIFLDDDGNGIQDAGNPGVGGLAVTLLDALGNTLATTVTDSTPGHVGYYSFGNLIPGTYQVQFSKPPTFSYTDPFQGGNTALDSNANQTTGLSGPINLVSGQDNLTIDAGIYERVTIGDTAFEDYNGDGIYNAGDAPLSGVTVTLVNSNNGKTYTAVTGADGQYLFKVPPGTYSEIWAPPAGYVTTLPLVGPDRGVDSNVNPATLTTAPITLTGGQSDLTQDGGFYRPVTIGDYVFVDINKDGLQQALEPGLAGVTVTLVDDRTGLVVGTQVTGSTGGYLFTGYKPSEYHVEFSTPAGYSITTPQVGSDRAIDSNPNAAGVAPQVVLRSGDDDRTIDAGYQGSAKVSGHVFLDLPPGICNYKLPDAVFEGIKVELITTTGLIAGITVTDALGNYSFDHVAPGTYIERFTRPDGTVFTQPKVAGTLGLRDSDVNPDGTTDVLTIANGDDVQQINAGLDYTGVGLTGLQPIHLPDGGGSYNFDYPGAYAIGGQGSYHMNGNGGAVYFIGGTGDNNLQGSGSSGAILVGGGGSNIMEGTGGRDIIIGGCGPNNFQGLGSNNFQGLGGGNACWSYDLLIGGVSNDIITSNSGNAIITGGRGDDALDGQGVFVGGPNNGTVGYNGTSITGYSVGDHLKLSGLSTVNYQVGDGVQLIENFNPGRGDTIEVWGYAAPTATGLVNGQYVMYFGPNAAIIISGYQPQNGVPLAGINYHAGQSSMPGAFGHLDALPPVVLAPGQDYFHGTQGDDIVIATDAFSTLEGRGGDDILFGGEGGNLFIGGPGNDTAIGGRGNDIFRAGQGSDQIIGCGGNNVVQFDVARAAATITANANGTFTVVVGGLENILKDIQWLSFTDQNVHLAGVPDAAGAVLFGTAGNDSFQITSAADLIVERPGQGVDTAWVSVNGWTLSPEVENGRLFGDGTDLTGNALDNVLVANATKASVIHAGSGNDELWGGAANGSILDGGAGDDVIRSGTGAETMIGGTGNDQFVVNNVGDVVIENAGEGIDTAWVGVNGWSVGANVDIVRLFNGATSLNFVGNAQVVADVGGSTIVAQLGDNVFWGQGGPDTFVGAAGSDIFRAGGGVTKMYGGAGNDHYIIKNLGDQAFENANEGYDTAYVTVNDWHVGNNIEVAYLSGTATSLFGSSTGGNLVANSTAASTLTAGNGLTTFWGSSFGDTFNIGTGGGTVYGYGGADDLHFGNPHWGLVEVADFSHAEGDRLDFQGSGIANIGQLTITNFADKVLVQHGADQIILYGVTAPLVNSDFIF